MNLTPLILVPGLMCNHIVWDPLMPWLAKDRTCTVADHVDADSLTDMAKRILNDAPDQMVLAGHSMGARVVLEALRLAPHRIKGVALLDTGYLPRPAGEAGLQEEQKRMALLHIAQVQGVRAMAREWVQAMVHPTRLQDAALIERILRMFSGKTADVFASQIQALLTRPDGTDVLRTISVPTLVLCGRQDSWSPVVQHEAMQALVNGSTLSIIDDAGHMAPMEQPQAVAQALLQWLAQCDSECDNQAR
jgi:pimeloyl-ACP methyl ester carboxylesterase